MHWLAVAGAVLAIAYYQVGSMSVWVSVLSITLKVILIVVAVVVVAAALMFLRRRLSQSVETRSCVGRSTSSPLHGSPPKQLTHPHPAFIHPGGVRLRSLEDGALIADPRCARWSGSGSPKCVQERRTTPIGTATWFSLNPEIARRTAALR